MRRHLLPLLLIMLPLAGLRAQDAHLAAVRDGLHQHLRMGLGQEKEGFEMAMTYTYCHRDSLHVPKAVNRVTMATGKGQFAMKSEPMCVYRDERHTATVLPGKRLVYLSESKPPKEADPRQQEMVEPQYDSLLDHCSVTQWTERQVGNGAKTAMAVVEPSPAAQRVSGVRRMVVHLDAGTHRLITFKTEFMPGQEMAYSLVAYEAPRVLGGKPVLPAPVEKMILNGGRLAPAYSNYTLIDLSKETNP